MVRCQHTLAQLFGVLQRKHGTELRLPEQDGLHRGASVHRDVGQHPQFFQRRQGQVLHLIDQQQQAAAGFAVLPHDMFVTHQQRCLVAADIGLPPETGHGQTQQIVAGHAGGDDAGHDVGAAVELGPQLFDQRRFAGPDLPGNDDEAFFLRQAVDQMRDGAAVPAGAEEKSAIRRQQERQSGQAIEFLVHEGTRQNCLVIPRRRMSS